MLYKAAEKGVINVARYYYYGTIYIGGQDNNIFNIRKGLDITKATNYKPESPMVPSSVAGVQGSVRKGRSTSRKRSSSCTSAPLPPNKRLYSSSPIKRPIMQNQVHQRVITYDYRKALYKASSLAAMLAALKGGIEGYKSLHT